MNLKFATRWDRLPIRKSVGLSQEFQKGDPFLTHFIDNAEFRKFIPGVPWPAPCLS